MQSGDTLSLAQFVRVSSGLPADIPGLRDLGYLATRMIADVLVLDPKRYRENATFAELDRLSSGVDYLLIYGRVGHPVTIGSAFNALNLAIGARSYYLFLQ